MGAVKDELNEVTGTQREMERVRDKLHKVKEEQTQIEGKVKDIKIELVECLETRHKGQDNLLQEQRVRIRSLKTDRDQVSPVSLCEVEQAHDAKGKGTCQVLWG